MSTFHTVLSFVAGTVLWLAGPAYPADFNYECHGTDHAPWGMTYRDSYHFEYQSAVGSGCVVYRFRNLAHAPITKINWRDPDSDTFFVQDFVLPPCRRDVPCDRETAEFSLGLNPISADALLTFGGILGKAYTKHTRAQFAPIDNPDISRSSRLWGRIKGTFLSLGQSRPTVDVIFSSHDQLIENDTITYTATLGGNIPAMILQSSGSVALTPERPLGIHLEFFEERFLEEQIKISGGPFLEPGETRSFSLSSNDAAVETGNLTLWYRDKESSAPFVGIRVPIWTPLE